MGKIHKALEKSKKERHGKTKSGFLTTGGNEAFSEKGTSPKAGARKTTPVAPKANFQEFDLGTIHDVLHEPSERGASNLNENNVEFKKEMKETPTKIIRPSISVSSLHSDELTTKKNENEFEFGEDESLQKSFDENDNLTKKNILSVEAPSIKVEPPVSEKKISHTVKPDTENENISVSNPTNSSFITNDAADNNSNFIDKKTMYNVSDTDFEEQTTDGIVGRNHLVRSDSESTDYNSVNSNIVALLKPRSFEAEQFKILRTNLLFPGSGKAARSILITSAAPGDGKSFVSANLAVSLALRRDRKVLLIDADVRRPEIHKIFGLNRTGKGVGDFLSSGMPLTSLLVQTSLKNLLILPAGKRMRNPSELQSLEKIPMLIEELAIHFSDYFIVIDSPPPKLASETGVLSRLVDSVVIIVKAGVTKREYIEETIDLLQKEKIAGIVFNWHNNGMLDYKKYAKNREYYS